MADAEDEMTNCSVCFEAYEEDSGHVPRMLPCSHTICEQCVRDLLRGFPGRKSVTCPECRQKHKASSGVLTFSQNKYVLSHIRKENARKVEMVNEKEKVQREAKLAEMFKELCSVHNRESHLYCIEKTCEKPICPWCLKTEHKDHDFEDLRDVKRQIQDQLKTTRDNMKEDFRQWQKDLHSKNEDVKKTFASFESRLKTEKEKRIRMVELMYKHFIKQAHSQLIGDIYTDINRDVENIEAKIKLVDEMETKDNSSVKDLSTILHAANQLQEDKEYDQRHRERCIKIEDVKKTLDAVTLKDASNALPMSDLKFSDNSPEMVSQAWSGNYSSCPVIQFICTKCGPEVWSLVKTKGIACGVCGNDGSHVYFDIFGQKGELVKSRRLELSPQCLHATFLDERYLDLFGSNTGRGTIEIMTKENVFSIDVAPHHPGALCVGTGSMLFYVDRSTFPHKVFQLDYSEISNPTKESSFTQTGEHQIQDMCCVKHGQNRYLLITANGQNGISAYTVANNIAKNGCLEWKNKGVIPGTELEMNACAVAADSLGRIFVCDSANRCIQLFSIDGAYLGEVLWSEIRGTPSAIRWNNDLSYLAITSHDFENNERYILIVQVE